MSKLSHLKPKRVFEIFEEICSIPRGSGDMERISNYCEDYAKKLGLYCVKDQALNVIIIKEATKGYENSEPIILQGHLDMVCQKTADSTTDFLTDGITVFEEDGFLKADGTTLGADNGIAVAMILAILESKDIPHPALYALFTVDEETGMNGASALDTDILKSKKLINLDSETQDVLTVSCAGGSDFKAIFTKETVKQCGTQVNITLKGLIGGHSGVEIDKGRVNASVLAGRFLNWLKNVADFSIISINGGDKTNAITNRLEVALCTKEPSKLKAKALKCLDALKQELKDREPDLCADITVCAAAEFEVFTSCLTEKLLYSLMLAPNGVCEMSASIKGLVETSLNLGILKTEQDKLILHYALRSNKASSLYFLEEKLNVFFKPLDCEIQVFGHYPPWEFRENSKLQELYKLSFIKVFGKEPKVEAIHAGLECAVFTSKIKDIDCISIGPDIFDVHTVNERLSIASTEAVFSLLLEILKNSQ